MGEIEKIQQSSLNAPNDLLKKFYNNSLCLDATKYLPEDNYPELLMGLLNHIVETPCNKILSILKEDFKPALITKANIPQFSSFEDCYTGVSRGILESGLEWVDFNKVGYLLRVAPRKEGADKKYGENHSKIASMLGLVTIQRGKRHCIDRFRSLPSFFKRYTKEEPNGEIKPSYSTYNELFLPKRRRIYYCGLQESSF